MLWCLLYGVWFCLFVFMLDNETKFSEQALVQIDKKYFRDSAYIVAVAVKFISLRSRSHQ